MSTDSKTRVVTTYRLREMKSRGEKISMLTAYDYSMARIVDAAGVDVVLVGDSAANVMAGFETTVPMTLDHMIYHARSVTRAVKRALVVVDMPFGTYQGNSREALASAVRIMKEAEADAVKLEGGEEILESVQRILCAGIPVMGHLGLTPPIHSQIRNLCRSGQGTGRGRQARPRRSSARGSRLFRSGAREDSGRARNACFAGTGDSYDRHRSRRRNRRTSARHSRYAGNQQRVLPPFPASLRRSLYADDDGRQSLCRGCQERRFPERTGAVLIFAGRPAALFPVAPENEGGSSDGLLGDRSLEITRRRAIGGIRVGRSG